MKIKIESLINFYPTTSILETELFYNKLIGLAIHLKEKDVIIFDTGYGYLGFVDYDNADLATKTCISFNLISNKEVDKMYSLLKASNIQISQPPQQHNKFKVYSMFVVDPNGYSVEFQKIN